MVTQNIDSFHPKLIKNSKIIKPKSNPKLGDPLYGFTEGVFEIHGNEDYMRCGDECHLKLYDYPKNIKKDEIPKCPKCRAPMKPHILLFDEIYREDLYRSESASEEALKSDCMIIVGTELATNLPSIIVYNHVYEDKFLIDINIRKVLDINSKNICYINESCEIALPKLINEVMNQKI